MTKHIPLVALEDRARVFPVLPDAPTKVRAERTFGLHPAVHMMIFGAWFSFVAILCATFMGPDLVVPAGICFIGVASLFVTPAWWARVAPKPQGRVQSWNEFLSEGVDTLTGRLGGRDALAQIMTLPVLLLGMALVFVVIKATL